MFTGTVILTFENAKNAHFSKTAPHFQKLKFTGIVNFDFSKTKVRRQIEFQLLEMQKKRIFKKICHPF